MPELPEVEHLRRTLEPRLVGRRVVSVETTRAGVTRRHDSERALDPRGLMLGATIRATARRGKQLAWLSDGPALVVQLGMTGRVLVGRRPAGEAHTHVRWILDDASCAEFIDPRRFGRLTGFPSADDVLARWRDTLGPDALGVRARALADAIAGRRTSIKPALLDQRLIAGIGNIYADEALFQAGIDPRRPARGLDPGEVAALASAIRRVLARAIDLGGSSIRDYRDALGRPGRQQEWFQVYERSGLACRRCGSVLRSARLAQRTTVWCPTCQPGSRSEEGKK